MKKIFLLLFILAATTVTAQNKDYIITTEGIGPIKLDMSEAALEKLLKKEISLPNPMDTSINSWGDSVKIRYKNIDVELLFQRRFVDVDTFQMVITWIGCKSPLCKTSNGLGVGSDKVKIIMAYETHYLDIQPVYSDEEKPVKSKTKSTISVREEEEGYTIKFNLVNNKVVSFEIFPVFDDEE